MIFLHFEEGKRLQQLTFLKCANKLKTQAVEFYIYTEVNLIDNNVIYAYKHVIYTHTSIRLRLASCSRLTFSSANLFCSSTNSLSLLSNSSSVFSFCVLYNQRAIDINSHHRYNQRAMDIIGHYTSNSYQYNGMRI